MKRKYAERADWKRILQRRYAQVLLDTDVFKGYISLLHTIKVSEPLFVRYGNEERCIVDDGYMWLQQFPSDQNHSMTVIFDAKGDVVQWYVDICHCNGSDEDKPWMDDLYLDLVLLPSGEIIELDADELEEALSQRIIDQSQYDLAWREFYAVKDLLSTGEFQLVNLAAQHKAALMELLE